MPTSQPAVKELQRALNRFTKRYLKGVAPLLEDGVKGHSTNVRIKSAKWFLGYGKTRNANDSKDTAKLRQALKSPKAKSLGWRVLRTGAARRLRQRNRYRQQHVAAATTRGVVRFDGVPCAAWLTPYLVWARKNGWKGRLNSGWRSPAYSRSLCYRICGAPSCSGRCAGAASNHSGSVKPRGALDVSDYARFGQLMARYPGTPKIHNALGARDPVHYSQSGR